MSSTNRGAVRSESDYYRTPAWCVEAIAPHIAGEYRAVIDPGCGDGAITRGLIAAGWRGPFYGAESNPSRAKTALTSGIYDDVQFGDFLRCGLLQDMLSGTPREAIISVGNPPYSLAMEFVQQSMGLAGTVCMLLRLPWMAGQKRAPFHREHPSDVYVLPKRPSFTGKGTDSCDYAWFVWGPGPRGRWWVL